MPSTTNTERPVHNDSYDYSKEVEVSPKKRSSTMLLRNKSNLIEMNGTDNKSPQKKNPIPSSPMKRQCTSSDNRNNSSSDNSKEENQHEEEEEHNSSPKKRIRANKERTSVRSFADRFSKEPSSSSTSRYDSPPPRQRIMMNNASRVRDSDKLSSSLNLDQRSSPSNNSKNKKIFGASTPKTERRPYSSSYSQQQHSRQNNSHRSNQPSRVQELATHHRDVTTASVDRSLSTSWADIIEQLEDQAKEFEEYCEKVQAKYGIEKEKLVASLESDAERLRKRQKLVNFGKVTDEYKRYVLEVPRKERKPFHPRTPNKFRKCSRRKFDGQVKKWRKLLHVWNETPHLLPEMKNSINEDCQSHDSKDEFGVSNITGISYDVDEYDICDDDVLDVHAK